MNFLRFLPVCLAAAVTFSYAVLDLPSAQPKVDASYWNAALDSTWQGMIRRNINPYSAGAGLIHRPKSETPGDAVSEGVGYGMLVALYANDQTTFNKMWEKANETMWNGDYHDWHMDPSGNIPMEGHGAATDAEEDIALALIFADKLVSAGKWTAYTSPKLQKTYAEQAQKLLNKMWDTQQILSSGIVAPGAGWGGDYFVNPGYFSPAWYKVFEKFDQTDGNRWKKAVDKCYEIISKSPGYSMGMVPDWMTPQGGWVGSEGLGYNAYFESRAFFKDAIRILWRVAIDAIWFDESRAKEFLKNALKFINDKGGPSAANFYQIEKAGELLPAEDKWKEFNDSKNESTWRYRREHSHLTIGMWATAAMAVGEAADRIAFSEEMAKFYEGGDYFGLAHDTSAALEDTLHNEMYFDQFLAWFGTSLMSGAFVNVVDAVDNPKTATPGDSSSLTKIPEVPVDSDTVVVDTSNHQDSGKGNDKPGDKIIAGAAKAAASVRFAEMDGGVMFSADYSVKWAVYDLAGNRVVSASGKNFFWNTRGLNGVYVVKAVYRGSNFTHKVLVR
ncbi:glycosyl hydrolase family 8 [uncultured Fibrobacter sp.]|uniref:glycosyl hydrolase family 8 n=1 Tax=uncultured Fibrobacter sp. TaxID=261512 RepID=UPI0025D10EDA|nr:glycosyl hydrolase family 8 [uncultured Fibrobacter sp.]